MARPVGTYGGLDSLKNDINSLRKLEKKIEPIKEGDAKTPKKNRKLKN